MLLPNQSCLTMKQIADLDHLNFEWDVDEDIWLEHFNTLKEFYRTNGHAKLTKIVS